MKISFYFIIVLIFAIGCQDNLVIVEGNENDPRSENYVPDRPDILTLKNITETGIQIEWKDLSAGEEGFVIVRKDPTFYFYSPIDTVPANVSEYLDEIEPIINADYYYRVYAVSENHKSGFSNILRARLQLHPPEDLKIEPRDEKSAILKWKNQNDSVKGFKVYFKRDSKQDYREVGEVPAGSLSFTLEGLNKDEEYYAYVQALFFLKDPKNSKPLKIVYGKEEEFISSVPISTNRFYNHYSDQLLFSPDGKKVVVQTFYNGKIELWNFDTNEPPLIFEGLHSTSFSPDGKSIALLSLDKEKYSSGIYFYDTELRKYTDSLNYEASFVDFNSSGDKILISNTKRAADNYLMLYDLKEKKEIWKIENEALSRARFSGSDKKIAAIEKSISGAEKIVILYPSNGERANVIEPSSGTELADFMLGGEILAFSASGASNYEFYDIETGAMLWKTDYYPSANLSGDGKIFTKTVDGTAQFYSTSKREKIHSLAKNWTGRMVGALNEDGTLFASADDYTLFLYSIYDVWKGSDN